MDRALVIYLSFFTHNNLNINDIFLTEIHNFIGDY